MGKADISWMQKKISNRSLAYRRCFRKGWEEVSGAEPAALPGDEEVGLDPTAV